MQKLPISLIQLNYYGIIFYFYNQVEVLQVVVLIKTLMSLKLLMMYKVKYHRHGMLFNLEKRLEKIYHQHKLFYSKNWKGSID